MGDNNVEVDKREALARVIDPEVWSLYDDSRMGRQSSNIRDMLVADSLEVADRIIASGLMASQDWERAEYLQARDRIIEVTSRSGRCESVSDALDGYFKHDPRCPNWPQSAIGGSSCDSWRKG